MLTELLLSDSSGILASVDLVGDSGGVRNSWSESDLFSREVLIVGILRKSPAASPTSSSAKNFVMLATLFDRFESELAILVTLSFRIMVLADERTSCSLRDLFVIPGNGRTSRVQMSASKASSRARSPLWGARIGTRKFDVVSRD